MCQRLLENTRICKYQQRLSIFESFTKKYFENFIFKNLCRKVADLLSEIIDSDKETESTDLSDENLFNDKQDKVS